MPWLAIYNLCWRQSPTGDIVKVEFPTRHTTSSKSVLYNQNWCEPPGSFRLLVRDSKQPTKPTYWQRRNWCMV